MQTNHRSSSLTRRAFTQSTLLLGAGLSLGRTARAQASILFYKNLGPGHIGVSGDQKQLLQYAIDFGFGGVTVRTGDLLKMNQTQRQELLAQMNENAIQWGPAGVPVDFRQDEDTFKSGLTQLPQHAQAMQQAGASRASTWIMPGHDHLNYLRNFKRHENRLCEIAKVYKDHGIRLGLEYVGTKTLRDRFRYHFIYTQSEMLMLCDAIGTGNVGLLLDSWHWHTAGVSVDEIRRLRNHDVVDVHVNDAPKDVPREELIDNVRRLPCTTGVIDMAGFINALYDIGYDGPISCEPFDENLRAKDNQPALKQTIAALNRVWAKVNL